MSGMIRVTLILFVSTSNDLKHNSYTIITAGLSFYSLTQKIGQLSFMLKTKEEKQ